jgi:hypothetical protein
MSEETNNLGVRTGMLIGKATIYGTDWCGYTTKQKQAFKDAKIPFDYVNCEKSPAKCAGIEGYPVVKGYPGPTDSWDGFQALPKGK